MSDALTLLPVADHKMDALVQPSGSVTGTALNMLASTAMTASNGQSYDVSAGMGGNSASVSDQFAALQAKSVPLDLNRSSQSAQDLAPAISSSTRLETNSSELASGAGNAVSDLLSVSSKTLPQPTDPSTGLPRLQFLSDTTAIKTPAVVDDKKTGATSIDKTAFKVTVSSDSSGIKPKTDTASFKQNALSSSPETLQDGASSGMVSTGYVPDTQLYAIPADTGSSDSNTTSSPRSMMLRSNAVVLSSYEDTPSLNYNVSGVVIVDGVTTGWSNQLTLFDNFNRAYPGIAVNTSYDDIGNRRDAAWVQPPMRAYATSDSGSRADTVQTWFKDNADTIGYNVIGTPIPYERYIAFRDWLHGEIKQHHMGNQETISNVLHMLATQDDQTTTQLNNIWHLVLGIAITSAELTDAITQISVGHATLSTERRDLAHSSQAAALYAQKYQDVHGHPPSDADIRFAQDKIGNGASLQQYIWDEAHNGQTPQEFGNVYRQVHGRDPRPVDIEFAQQKIGNGASLQQYRWDEIHSESAAQDFRAMFRNVAGKEASDGDVQWLQNAVANGSNFISLRQNLAWSDFGRNASVNAYYDAANITPDDATIRSWQGNLAAGGTYQAMRQAIVNAHGADAVRQGYRDSVNITPDDAAVQSWKDNLLNGGTYQAMRQAIVNVHGADAVRQVYRDSVNITPDDAAVRSWKDNLINGGTYQAMRQAIVNYHGHDAVRNVYARTAGIQNPEQFQYDCYQGQLANGASIADITRNIANAWEGKNAVQAVYARTAGIQNPEQFQYDCYQGQLANGASIADITRNIANAWEGKQAVDRLYLDVLGRESDQSGLKTYQDQLAAGRSLTEVRHDLAYSTEATDHLQRLVSTLVAPDAWNDRLAILQQDLATKDSLLYILGHPDNFIGVRLEDLYISYEPYPETLSKFFGVNPENGKQNCIFCTNAMIARIYSKDANAVAPLSGRQGLSAFDPKAFVSEDLTVKNVDDYMRKLKHGDARALVLEAPGDPDGHAIVAYNDNGNIRYLDGQKGWEVKLKDNLELILVHRDYDDPPM